MKKGVLRNLTKFTGKHLPEACNFIKKETLAQVFSYEFCEIFKNTSGPVLLKFNKNALTIGWL